MVGNSTLVTTRINWYAALNAIREMVKTRDVDRLTILDAEKLEEAAKIIRGRLSESSTLPTLP